MCVPFVSIYKLLQFSLHRICNYWKLKILLWDFTFQLLQYICTSLKIWELEQHPRLVLVLLSIPVPNKDELHICSSSGLVLYPPIRSNSFFFQTLDKLGSEAIHSLRMRNGISFLVSAL